MVGQESELPIVQHPYTKDPNREPKFRERPIQPYTLHPGPVLAGPDRAFLFPSPALRCSALLGVQLRQDVETGLDPQSAAPSVPMRQAHPCRKSFSLLPGEHVSMSSVSLQKAPFKETFKFELRIGEAAHAHQDDDG